MPRLSVIRTKTQGMYRWSQLYSHGYLIMENEGDAINLPQSVLWFGIPGDGLKAETCGKNIK